ncbi:MAG: hypothetical protein O4859_18935 [Trichodesmium sp. St18_bin1]|nr:hypothetical protein [Trichodesmium sp. St18_bin1]
MFTLRAITAPNPWVTLPGVKLICGFSKVIDISKNTQTLILTIFSGAIATYEDS